MFYIIEIQQYQDLTYGHLVHWADTRNKADSKYHEVLAAAAISELPSHSATLIDSEGNALMNYCYHHEQPEPEETTPEPVTEEPEAEPEIDNADEQEPVDETPVDFIDPNEGVD